jgi:signal transduction histidine kinase
MRSGDGDILAFLEEHRLNRLIEVGRGLTSEHDLETVLRRVLDTARELTGARYAALGVLDEHKQGLERFLYVGIDEQTRRRIGDLPQGHGVLGVLIQDPRPLRLDDVGGHPRSFGFPPAHPPMRTFLGVPVLIRGEAYGNLYLTEKDRGSFDEHDEQAALTLAGWAAIAIENARLYGDLERRRRELERAVARLEATTDIARAVGGETDLKRILETIAKRARALVEARSLLIMLDEGPELVGAATAGELASELRGRRMPSDGSLAGQVLRSGGAERVSDVSSRLRLSPKDLGAEAAAVLLVPLVFRGRPLGVIIGFDRLEGGPEFTEEDERLMQGFAASAATAVATAQSVAEQRVRHSIEASERERGRWARELHDETLQALGALRVVLSSGLKSGATGLDRATRDAISQLGAEIEKLRALITELRPAALDEIGLGAAIEALAERSASVHGLEVDCEVDLAHETGRSSQRLDPELESTVYRVVQEGITNVAKHSRAERLWLRVVETDARIEIEVADDGVGFDPEAGTEGFGLLGMRERIGLAGGSLNVRSSIGAGSTLQAQIPAEHREARRPMATGDRTQDAA